MDSSMSGNLTTQHPGSTNLINGRPGPGTSSKPATASATRSQATASESAVAHEASAGTAAFSSVSHLADPGTLSVAQQEDVEVRASGSGIRLFQWLVYHFPCRIFVDNKRSRFLVPERLFQVHPSPVVALLRQQQLLLHQQQLALQGSGGDPKETKTDQQKHHDACPALLHRLQRWAARNVFQNHDLPSTEVGAAAEGRISSSDMRPPPTSTSGGLCSLCEIDGGLRGTAWICSAKDSHEGRDPVICPIDDFAFPFGFVIDSHGVCDIFPLPLPPRQLQQHQQQPQQGQQQDLQATTPSEQPPGLGGLRLVLQRSPSGAFSSLRQYLEGTLAQPSCCSGSSPEGSSNDAVGTVTDSAVRELFFYLWGPADACMAADAAACAFAQWRLSFDFCSDCRKRRCVVYEQPLRVSTSTNNSSSNSTSDSSNSSSSYNSNSNSSSKGSSDREMEDPTLIAVSAGCTCCSLRCCCIRIPQCVLEAVARDEFRLPSASGSSSDKNNSTSSSKRSAPERLLRYIEDHGASEPSSDEDSWLSELPSSPESASPPGSPRTHQDDTAGAAEGPQGPPVSAAQQLHDADNGHTGNDSSCGSEEGSKPFSTADRGLSGSAADAAVASLRDCLAVCLPKAGVRVTPLLNNSTLDDAAWIVSGARNVNPAQMTSQAASARSFLAFACTEPWEVLLLLHASAETAHALSNPLQGCADLCSGPPSSAKRNALRLLAARPRVYEQLAVRPENSQQQQQMQGKSCYEEGDVSLPFWLSLVESRELQKGREFRVFAAGGLPIGICQLWLAECIPELIKSSSLRRKIKRAVWSFLLQVLSRQELPPLFIADVYIHRNADGTDSCRLLRLNPWGFSTDPLLFTYEELRELMLKDCCSESELNESGISPSTQLPRHLGGSHSWERCELRYISGTDEEIHDAQRALAMPQDLLEIAKGGGNSNVEEMLLNLKAAHADVIKKQKHRK